MKTIALLAFMMCFSNVSLMRSQEGKASVHAESYKAEYARLSTQIFSPEGSVPPKNDGSDILNKEQIEDIAKKMHGIVAEEIMSVIAASPPSSSAVTDAIKQLQGATSFTAWGTDEVTNTPCADTFELGGRRVLMVSYTIMSGGAVIPQTLPYIEFYSPTSGKWELKGAAGSELTASTLFVKRFSLPSADENWYLVWGSRLGDTAARLNVRLYGFNGDSVRTIYRRDDLIRGLIEVSDRSITLEYDKVRHAPELDRVHETLYLTPNGLQ